MLLCKDLNQDQESVDCILGEGNFGKVIKSRCSKRKHISCNGKIFMAEKILHGPINEDTADKIKREFEIHSKLSTSEEAAIYTIQLYHWDTIDSSIHQYFEFIDGIEFGEYKKDDYKKDKDLYKDEIIIGLIKGLHAIHKLNIIHCDIKPENILIDTSKTPYVPKYIDFGLAVRSITNNRKCPIIIDGTGDAKSGLYGTKSYILKDEIVSQYRTARSDIYALFKSFYEIYDEDIYTIIPKEQFKKIINNNYIWRTFHKIYDDLIVPPPSPPQSVSNIEPMSPSSSLFKRMVHHYLSDMASLRPVTAAGKEMQSKYSNKKKKMEKKVVKYIKNFRKNIPNFYTLGTEERRKQLGCKIMTIDKARQNEVSTFGISKPKTPSGLRPRSIRGKRKSKRKRITKRPTKKYQKNENVQKREYQQKED